MVTIKDIAKACGVAVSTVSYALNNDSRIPIETRTKIQNKAKKMGYRGKSGKVRNNRKFLRQIVVCFSTINGDLYTEIYNAIHHTLHLSNCKTVIYCGDKVDNIRSIDGLICLNIKVDINQIRDLTYRKIPVVMMDRTKHINTASNIVVDNYQGAYEITKKVLEKGVKRVIYVAGPSSNEDANERYKGFLDALKDSNFNARQVVLYRGDFTYGSGVNIANNLLSLSYHPEAILCANDEMALGVIDTLAKHGYQLGKNVYVSGFDGWAPKTYLGFITGYYDVNNWASLATYTLLQQFDKQTHTEIKIPVEVREY